MLRYFWHPLWSINSRKCDSEDDFTRYHHLGLRLFNMDEKRVGEVTGCIGSCKKFYYSTRVVNLERRRRKRARDERSGEQSIDLTFIFASASYGVKFGDFITIGQI